jgi:hypothetical protein
VNAIWVKYYNFYQLLCVFKYLYISKGQFMHVKRRRTNVFSTQLQFRTKIVLKPDDFYKFEFNYLINYDVCNRSEVVLTVFLRDEENFKEILFDSVLSVDSENITNYKWNEFNSCFQADSNVYFLFIIANSTCGIELNEAFIAIDDISLNRVTDSSGESVCNDYRVPSTVISTTESITSKQTESTLEISTTERPIRKLKLKTSKLRSGLILKLYY